MRNISEYIEKNYKIIFAVILGLAILLNTYKLSEVPSGIHNDEAGAAYDAYCLANYGVDRFCKKNPVYFINFGDGQNALYTYLYAFILKLFKINNYFTLRLPALILSVIEVVVCYLLVKEFRSKKEALLFMLLVTISPWHIMKSRWALESYLLSPMLLFSIYSLIKAIKASKYKLLKFALSGLIFGITLYTYAISYIIIPIFLLLMLLYLIEKKKIKVSEVIVFACVLFILAVPLILMLMVQQGWIEEINSFITIPKMMGFRVKEINISKIFENLSTLKYVLLCDYLPYNSIRRFGTLYYFGTCFMIIGIIITIIKINKKQTKKNEQNILKDEIDLDMIMILVFISNIIIALLIRLNANKLNGIFISATYFELVTLKYIYKNIKPVFYLITATYIIAFVMFIKTYFTEFKINNNVCWDNNAIELMKYLQKFNDKQIHADGILYIFNLYANPISPFEFNESKKIIDGNVYGYKNYDGRRITDINDCNTDDIYVTKNLNKAQDMMKAYDFTMENYKNQYYILYKNNK